MEELEIRSEFKKIITANSFGVLPIVSHKTLGGLGIIYDKNSEGEPEIQWSGEHNMHCTSEEEKDIDRKAITLCSVLE